MFLCRHPVQTSCAGVLCKRPVACVPGCAPVGPCLEVFPAAERIQVSGPARPGGDAQGTSVALPMGSGTTRISENKDPDKTSPNAPECFCYNFLRLPSVSVTISSVS